MTEPAWSDAIVPHLQAHILFTSIPFTDLFSLTLKAEQPIKTFHLQLSVVLQKETDSSERRETSYYVMTIKRAGQVRGGMNPWPPWAAECAGDHRAVDELVDSRTVHLVTFSVTCRTADGCVFNPISTWPVEAGHRDDVVSVDHWIWSKLAHESRKSAGHFLSVLLSGGTTRTWNTLFKPSIYHVCICEDIF